MTDTIAPGRPAVRVESRFFYFHMMLACSAVAFLGFLPSYWTPLVQGTLAQAPVAHIHGIIFFGWSLYIVFQSWLGATGQIVRHRAVGLIGVSLATAMVTFGVLISIQSMREATAAGHPQAGVAIATVSLTNIAIFAVIICFALANIRKPETHKRLMVMAAVSILQAPMARWFIYYLHMPPPVSGTEFVLLLLALVPVMHDWRTRGLIHPAYWVPIAATTVVHVVRMPLGQTQAWHATASWVLGLAG